MGQSGCDVRGSTAVSFLGELVDERLRLFCCINGGFDINHSCDDCLGHQPPVAFNFIYFCLIGGNWVSESIEVAEESDKICVGVPEGISLVIN